MSTQNTRERPVEPVDLDAWECPDCGGEGRVTRYHKVTHQLGSDDLPFWDECETCEGVGFCGTDAALMAAAKTKGQKS